jgi:ROK family/Mannosylglycerate hydrolase MGH1-like glycoside hydrolase domain
LTTNTKYGSTDSVTLCAIGIDIGGGKIAAALVGPDGNHTDPHTVATPAACGALAILHAAIESGQQLVEFAHAQGIETAAIGLGTGGYVDPAQGVIAYASNLLPGWAGLELAREIQSALDLPVSIENDANVMALGEARGGVLNVFRRNRYDPQTLLAESPFLVQDTFVNSILHRADQDLRALALELGEPTYKIEDWLKRARASFDTRFWNDERGP